MRAPSTRDDQEFARAMLPRVSRTFARAISILPDRLADPVCLAYLLCRVADTIEDATRIPPTARRSLLLRYAALLSDRMAGDDAAFAEEASCALRIESPETALVAETDRLLRLLADLPDAQRGPVIHWTREMALGMARFVTLEKESRNGWTSLATCEDLTAYEYTVAGTVGCMLNDLFEEHVGGFAGNRETLRRSAVSLGLGLQGTNILQDLSTDRDRGWSYLPEEIAGRHGSATDRLERPGDRAAAIASIHEMVDRAAYHLDQGFAYIVGLPRRHARIRLFCLWPLLLALRTLSRIAATAPLAVSHRVRISRAEVRELTRRTIWVCLSNAALRRIYQRERAAIFPRT